MRPHRTTLGNYLTKVNAETYSPRPIKPPGERLAKLSAAHDQAACWWATHPLATAKEVAAKFGWGDSYFSNTIAKHPLFTQRRESYQREIANRMIEEAISQPFRTPMRELVPMAAEHLKQTLLDPEARVRDKNDAAEKVLNYGLGKATRPEAADKEQKPVVNITISSKDQRDLQKIAAQPLPNAFIEAERG